MSVVDNGMPTTEVLNPSMYPQTDQATTEEQALEQAKANLAQAQQAVKDAEAAKKDAAKKDAEAAKKDAAKKDESPLQEAQKEAEKDPEAAKAVAQPAPAAKVAPPPAKK